MVKLVELLKNDDPERQLVNSLLSSLPITSDHYYDTGLLPGTLFSVLVPSTYPLTFF